MKLLYSQVRPLVAQVVGLCEADARVASYTNQACRRLLRKGLWAGCYGRFTICTCNGCIVWPRMVETIESFASCWGVGSVRNQWFEFLEGGFGLNGGDAGIGSYGGGFLGGWGYNSSGGQNLIDRGNTCTYRDISGGQTSYLRAYPGDRSDVGRTMILRGNDENGIFIRTQVNGVWIDGEQITLALPYAQTTKKFTTLTTVIRQTTNTVTRLYEYNGTDVIDLAVYDPDETLPEYRRSVIPQACLPNASEEDRRRPVTIMAKLRHIPVSADNDIVIPPCEDAIKLMAQCIRKEQNDLIAESAAYEQRAVAALQEMTLHYLGDAVVPMRIVGGDVYGGAMVNAY
jgi:hypothetical protein